MATQTAPYQTIQPLRSIEPCRILKTLHKNKLCISYLVAVKLPGNQEEMNILQVFPPEAAHAYEAAETALRQFWSSDLIECIKGAGDIRYIFIKTDGADLLTWQKISAMPLEDRIAMVFAIANRLEELAAHNILMNGAEVKDAMYYPANGTASFWDFSCAVIADGDTSGEVRSVCQAATMKKVAEFAYWAIMGRVCAKKNAQAKLLMTLCHKLPEKHLRRLLDTFTLAFSRPRELPLSEFIKVLDDTQIYLLETPSLGNNRGSRDACTLAAADFLDKNPLYPYVREEADGSKHLNVVLVGKSSMRMAFFTTIFSCAQMLDTQLHIHIISKDADQFYSQCIREAPMLAETTVITHIPAQPECAYTLNETITGKDRSGKPVPFACLTFEKTASFPTAEKLEQCRPGCVLLLDAYSDEVSRHIRKFAVNHRHALLLGICNPEPVHYDFSGKNSLLNVRSFTGRGTSYRRKPLTQSEIYQKALDIHTFYSKGSNQRISRQEILAQFGDVYYRDSSIRSALTIPYKLHAYQLTDCETVSERFAETVLADPNKLKRLVWLEHRSWQTYLITRGWTLQEADLEKQLVENKFSHRNEQKKWHACLLGSNDSTLDGLEQWRREDWTTRDSSKLDPLDQLSVKFHRILADAVHNTVEPKLDACMNLLEEELSTHILQQVKNAVNALRTELPNGEVVWARLKKELPQSKSVGELCALVQCLVLRNQRRNFKTSDLDIIQAIPYLLRDSSIRCVYKLCADHPWDNVAVSTFVEPQKLILVTDAVHTLTPAQQEHISNFLQDRRCLEIDVHAQTVDTILNAEKDAVLDMTGAAAEQVILAQLHPVLGKLPLVGYSGGKLINPDGKYPQIRFYPAKKSLTVVETMALTGTKVSTENIDIPMQRLYQYQKMWKASQFIPDYTSLCDFLSTLRLNPRKVYRDGHRWDTTMSYKTAKKYGIIRLLEDLKKKGLVQYDTFQEVYVQNGLFCCRANDWCNPLQKLEEMIQDGKIPENCMFSVVKDWNPKINNWYIKHRSESLFTLKEQYPQPLRCTKDQAAEDGLLDLLNTLQNDGIVASFEWKDKKALQVNATDPYCQISLNKMLDHFLQAPKEKRSQYKPHYVTEDPEALCVLEDMSLEVSQRSVVRNGKLSYTLDDSNRILSYNTLETGLRILSENGLIDKTYRLSRQSKPGSEATVDIQFAYTDEACLDCLTKAGNSLEAFAYHSIRQMGIFDDVKLGVSIFWNDRNSRGRDTKNEIDIICTKGTKTYFISCKNTKKLHKEFLTEIRYETDHFGVDGTAILLTTASRQENSPVYLRAQHMGVEIIQLQKYAPAEKCENSEKVLRQALVTIVEKYQR